jgi:type I restriction enzyme S subunit
LEEVCSIYDGPHATPAKRVSGPYFLSISSLQDGRLDLSESAFLSEEDYVLWTKRVTPIQGDIVFSYETRLGQAAMIPSGLRCCLGRRMGLLRTKDTNIVDPTFLLHYYLGAPFQQIIKDNTVFGTTVDRIPLQKMGDFEVLLPPLSEQKKIAEILSGIDLLTQKINTKITKLKQVRSAFIQNLHLEDPGEWVALEEFADFVTSGSRGWSQYYSDTGAKFVRIGNLSRDSIDLDPAPDKWQLVAPPEGAEGARTRLEEGDILISITADLGICGIYSARIGEAYINQHIALVRVHSEGRHFSRQIAYYICSDHCQEQIRAMNDSGAKAGLNLDSIRRIRVPLIQGGANSGIIRSIDSLQSAISGNLLRLQRLEYEKSALASDLLSGRKRVTL